MIDGWNKASDRLRKTLEFRSFSEAIAFMVKASKKIEEMDHHPEWQNINCILNIELTTHNTGGVTPLDEELARYLNALYTECQDEE